MICRAAKAAGADTLDALARETGMPRDEVLRRLTDELPQDATGRALCTVRRARPPASRRLPRSIFGHGAISGTSNRCAVASRLHGDRKSVSNVLV
jgi:hypothetical protein